MRIRPLAMLVIAIAFSGPARAASLLPEVLKCESPRTSLHLNGPVLFDRSSFTDPSSIQSDSAAFSVEYNAENLARVKTGGVLTENMQTWGSTESVLVPLHFSIGPTTLALSHTSSSASLCHADMDNGTNMAWESNTQQWALTHSFGATRIGIAGSTSSASAPGESLYPRQLFDIFSGWTPLGLHLNGQETLVQVTRPIEKRTEVSLKLGSDITRLRTDIGEGGSLISVPASTNSLLYGVDVKRQLRKTTSADFGFSRSRGSSSGSIYRSGDPIGKLRYEPGHQEISGSVLYQKRQDTIWEAGFTSSRWQLGLRGISIYGDALGLSLKPFSERIDFNSNTGLSADIWHVGMQRKMSDKWSWGWQYKLARVKSAIDADYVGRAFFGLISASGNYDKTLLAARIHALELSARYAHGRTSIEVRLDQAVPQSSSSGSPSAAGEKSSSTGGTSISVISGYAL